MSSSDINCGHCLCSHDKDARCDPKDVEKAKKKRQDAAQKKPRPWWDEYWY